MFPRGSFKKGTFFLVINPTHNLTPPPFPQKVLQKEILSLKPPISSKVIPKKDTFPQEKWLTLGGNPFQTPFN